MYRSFLKLLVLSTLLIFGAASAATTEQPFPGAPPSKSLLKAQQKGDQLYKDGEYERALVIYRDDLAPSGDKFAQYMVGYMHLAGQAVNQDPIAATAWYRLAAERGEESFVYARDTLLGAMNAAQRSACDEIYEGLRKKMGDMNILMGLIKEDLDILAPFIRSDLAIDPNLMQRSSYGRNEKELNILRLTIETRMAYLLDISFLDESIAREEQERINRLNDIVRRDLLKLDAMQFNK